MLKLKIANTVLKDGREIDLIRFVINDRTDFSKFTGGVENRMQGLLGQLKNLSTEEKVCQLQEILLTEAKACFKQKGYTSNVKGKIKLPNKLKGKMRELNTARKKSTRMEIARHRN